MYKELVTRADKKKKKKKKKKTTTGRCMTCFFSQIPLFGNAYFRVETYARVAFSYHR